MATSIIVNTSSEERAKQTIKDLIRSVLTPEIHEANSGVVVAVWTKNEYLEILRIVEETTGRIRIVNVDRLE